MNLKSLIFSINFKIVNNAAICCGKGGGGIHFLNVYFFLLMVKFRHPDEARLLRTRQDRNAEITADLCGGYG